MAYDPNTLAEIDRLKFELDRLYLPDVASSENPQDLFRLALMMVTTWGGTGGATATPGLTPADITTGVVAAIAPAAAIDLTPTVRIATTNTTIAAGALGYQIFVITGSFTIAGDPTPYAENYPVRGVYREFSIGKKYPAVTITPGAASQIWIEELR